MSELRVPTVALAAEVVLVDGRTLVGRIFVPVASAGHGGPMRADEWLNETGPFLPFLVDKGEAPVLLNKHEVLVASVLAEADAVVDEGEAESQAPRKHVIVECRNRRIQGELLIDMPSHRSRVLDYLNRPEAFLTVREGAHHHLVQKARITQVVEVPE
jgi:hypothetical protein